MVEGTLVFDIETQSADLMYTLGPEQIFRIGGYAWDDGEVIVTTDLEELRQQILSARWIIGHNIHAFDLRVVFGVDSDIPMQLADEGRVYDTWTHAALVNPAPRTYINREGKTALAEKPEQMTRWFSLDEQAHQLGVSGKTDDLKTLAKEFGGFGSIPLDEPRYIEYLKGDVIASRAVARELLRLGGLDAYALREQRVAARAAVISSNGVRLDQEAAQHRVDTLTARKRMILEELQTKYGLPTEGKSPWATTEGKAAILAALADHGITPETHDWPLTKTGNISLGGEALIGLTKGTSAEELGEALAELKGQRSLAQLALDSMHPDGRVHPDISMLQRSGRWSTTKPGLTVWTSRGDGAVEKSYFLPDSDDEVLIEIDYSNADARIVAAYSGDTKYAERFEPGADGHMINALAAWGEETVSKDPKHYRQLAKPLGHGWNYGGRPGGLSRASGLPIETAKSFCEGMDRTYAALVAWQNRVRKEARVGYVTSEWGRKLWVEKDRVFTQAPALVGQNGTREIVCDALLRMPYHWIRRVKAQIHDAVLFSVPKDIWEECREYLVDLMTTEFKPKRGGQLIEFPVSAGPAGANWQLASHE